VSRPRGSAEIARASNVLISLISLISFIATLSVGGCQRRDLAPSTPVSRGRLIYETNCAACHNADPTQPGVLGPPIEGSSRILITDRVTSASYPPGYTPKRATHLMQRLPWLKPRDVDDLTAFLASGTKSDDN